jgi:hypothetical protein
MNAISSLSSARNDRRAINKMAHMPAQAAYDRVYRDQRPLVGGPAAHVAAKLAYAEAFDMARAQLSGVSVSRPFTPKTDTAIFTPPAVADIVAGVAPMDPAAPIAPAVVDKPVSVKPKPAVKASRGSLLEQYRAAVAAAAAEYGDGGNYPKPHGWSATDCAWIIATMPKGWIPVRTVNGTRIKTPHERLRVPAARYWAGGVLPAAVRECIDPPAGTDECQWGEGQKFETYQAWQNDWARRNGLVFTQGIWIPAEHIAQAA